MRLDAFTYVARQVAIALFSFLKSLGQRAGARGLAARVWGWFSTFTGCPNLFAEGSRPRVETRMERCLHANKHCDAHRRVPERRLQTAPSGNTANSDVITPERARRRADFGFAVGPDK